ncbi:uncharacterized protein LOC110835807 isoform X2 [Zootermopsis nevadensis]|uniref:Uncharacterized protein n=1 Tax=Zootermopsis nevadensis TaxID=136037 RepID=A0A067RUP4_ZOONE|nr:uncharacterized protein LOC110835807 isoform X2 [Zootermopsis nevadensis]KDR23559.1 hypothetical protein L798_12381 [Zootermopsis nevadensis]
MVFSKSQVPRFKEEISCAPPPTRYAPKTDSQIKGIVSYEKQTTARFDAGKFHSENEGGRMPRTNTTLSQNLDKEKGKMRTCDTEFMCETPRSRKLTMEKELPEEQESIVEECSCLDSQYDSVLNSHELYLKSLEENNSADLRRINISLSTTEAAECSSDGCDITVTESTPNDQDQISELWCELQACQVQLKSDEDYLKREEEEAAFLEEVNKAVYDRMRVQQKLVLDAINKNEQLQEIKNRQQLMIDQKDPVMCQQCTFSIGCEELQQDKQADKVNKETSLRAYEEKLKVDRIVTEVGHLKDTLKKMQEEKIRYKAHRLSRDGHIAQLERAIQKTEREKK